MNSTRRINVYVTFVVALAIATMAAAWQQHLPFPGIWPSSVLLLVAFLLQISATTVRGGDAKGSLSFIVHLAGGILFGAFWGGALAAVSTAFSQAVARREPIKVVFNVSQRTLSLASAILVYGLLGGALSPAYLTPGGAWIPQVVVRQVLAFFAGAAVYFALNSVLVSAAVAISRGKSLRQVWATGFLWVLGYDIGASSLALLVAWIFLKFDSPDGLSKLAFLAIFLPLIAAKHVYAKLNTLQSLYDELDGAYEKLELNVREQLEMMVKSIEARDPYTSGHSRRVAALSKAIAQDLGLEAKLVDEIENAALLHDVGKIHAEFAPLLSKEGRLTEEEWEIMKTHSAKSAELVTLFSRFRGNVLESVRWHHERWDGKGYPDGIVGEAIPMGARIIMVADTIDAMSTDRPYRKALSFEKVVSELIKYRAVQFDPGLVDVTVNSVTVRRLVSDKDFLAEQTHTIKPVTQKPTRPALRSQRSFWEGLRSSVGQE
ncbi:MAG TPA: HD-GYP domain-containing protein [Gemmatimonadales bacterium]|jgi:HD-GYP domain-containing protein (c-di-GMP phosphodiesterase class II)|nr:HD-GYP domain-containing protein [Gemmatimonadales bacterium]